MQDRPGSLVGSYAGYLLSHELEALSAELVAAIRASVADYAELAAVGRHLSTWGEGLQERYGDVCDSIEAIDAPQGLSREQA